MSIFDLDNGSCQPFLYLALTQCFEILVENTSEHISLEAATRVLTDYWGYPSFRPKQREIIQSVGEEAVVGLLPTGGGKSLCYQVPALVFSDMTLVISPLVSLMDDQVDDLRGRGVAAERLHSGLASDSIDRILNNCILGKVKLLYVSPERLSSPLFLQRIMQCKLSLIAIDEAHCISQWGHDFRPSYLGIKKFVQEYSKVPIIALTASATPMVLDEIKKQLNRSSVKIVRDSFARTNLSITITESNDKVNDLRTLVQRYEGQKVLIYCRSRRQVQMIAQIVAADGRPSAYYHAGLKYDAKQKILDAFKRGQISCVAATNAFGMGIDISDIRVVVHFDIAPSIEEYYQEIGRAGRDGQPSYAYLIYQQADISFLEKMMDNELPLFDDLKAAYKRLNIYYGVHPDEGEGKVVSLDIVKMSKSIKLLPKKGLGILRALSTLGLLEIGEQRKESHSITLNQSLRSLRQSEEARRYPAVIDHILRSEGVTEGWVSIDPARLAKRLAMSQDALIQVLKKLDASGAIRYYHQSEGQTLAWRKNRLTSQDMEHLRSRYHTYAARKRGKTNAMLRLVQSDECIMMGMLQYFGEYTTDRCGQCHNCREGNGATTGQYDSIASMLSDRSQLNEAQLLQYQRWVAEGIITVPSELE